MKHSLFCHFLKYVWQNKGWLQQWSFCEDFSHLLNCWRISKAGLFYIKRKLFGFSSKVVHSSHLFTRWYIFSSSRSPKFQHLEWPKVVLSYKFTMLDKCLFVFRIGGFDSELDRYCLVHSCQDHFFTNWCYFWMSLSPVSCCLLSSKSLIYGTSFYFWHLFCIMQFCHRTILNNYDLVDLVDSNIKKPCLTWDWVKNQVD